MEWVKEAEKELQAEANMALGNMHETDMFHSLESSLREIKDLQKVNPQGDKTLFIELREEEEIEDEEILACEETKKK